MLGHARIFLLVVAAAAAVPVAHVAAASECEECEHCEGGTACETWCPGDDAEGECPPTCHDCACCGGLATGAHTLVGLSVREVSADVVGTVGLAQGNGPSGVTARVFRPPRSLLS